MSDDRKATDILVGMEKQLMTLIKTIGVYDINSKLILDRLNKLLAYVEGAQKEDAKDNSQSSDTTTTTIVQSLPSEYAIPMEENPNLSQRRGTRQEIITPTASDKKVPVVQRITDHIGKDMFMAEVSILDLEDNVVHKTKTNAVGKWQALLKPGNYKVKVVKTDTATKSKIEATQDISVNDTNATIVLPVAIIKRNK